MLVFSWLTFASCKTESIKSTSVNSETGEVCQNTFAPTEMPHEDHGDHSSGEMPEELEVTELEDVLPERLSETPLYSNIQNKEIHSALLSFIPKHPLWSDGTEKSRWIYIPECEKIDTSDMNDWQFPVGTRFFKEFSIDGQRIETRLIERMGPGPRDFAHASYLWNSEETEATRVSSAGLQNANGSTHDVPSKQQCLQCHGTYSFGGGRPSRGLGISAIQLHESLGDTTLQGLIDEERLSNNPNLDSLSIPGNATEQAALGYLHANCGHCHNRSRDGIPHTDLSFWVDVGLTSVDETDTYLTAVGQGTILFKDQHITARIQPGIPEESAVFYRMENRGNNAMMPPVGSKLPDEEGLEIVLDWIEGLQ
jgi:hypothetical protein